MQSLVESQALSLSKETILQSTPADAARTRGQPPPGRSCQFPRVQTNRHLQWPRSGAFVECECYPSRGPLLVYFGQRHCYFEVVPMVKGDFSEETSFSIDRQDVFEHVGCPADKSGSWSRRQCLNSIGRDPRVHGPELSDLWA
jgi:hypothetical protein